MARLTEAESDSAQLWNMLGQSRKKHGRESTDAAWACLGLLGLASVHAQATP